MEERQFDINEAIENVIRKLLETYSKDWYRFYVVNKENIIEAGGQKKMADNGSFLIIRLGINHEFGEVQISNIFIPQEDRGQKIGLLLIHMIYKIAERFDYVTCLVDMTDSFRTEMLRRGAIETNVFDALQIVESTTLV